MRWKTKPLPKHGDKKTVKRFALLPMELYGGTTVWLETYYADKVYHNGYAGGSWGTIRRYPK